MSEGTSQSKVLTLKRLIVVLALLGLLLATGLIVTWLSRPGKVTFSVLQPAGQTVLCHLVVDGQAHEIEDVVPFWHHYEATELRFAATCLDPTVTAGVAVVVDGPSIDFGSATGVGLKGVYQHHWWSGRCQFEGMTSTHIANMRASAMAERGEAGGNEGNEVPSP